MHTDPVSGVFSFDILAPTVSGTPTLTFQAVDGTIVASQTSAAALRFWQANVLLNFDFNGPSNDTTSGWVGVRGSRTYSDALGYGWNQTTAELERPTTSTFNAPIVTKSLYRDGALGLMGTAGARTFDVKVARGSSGYNVRVYLGDQGYFRDLVQVNLEGSSYPLETSSAANQFAWLEFSGPNVGRDANNDGKLDITISDNGGWDRYWVVNAIQVWTGADPGVQHLTAEGVSTKDEGQSTKAAGLLTAAELQPVVLAAVQRWAATGLSAAQVAALAAVPVRVEDLGPQAHLGETTPGQVLIDDDGAGYGWFVDVTPGDDAEFAAAVGRTERVAAPGTPAADRMDLLTVVMHELGHVLGLGDLDPQTNPGELMDGQLAAGLRRVPEGVGQEAGVRCQVSGVRGQEAGAEDITLSPGHLVSLSSASATAVFAELGRPEVSSGDAARLEASGPLTVAGHRREDGVDDLFATLDKKWDLNVVLPE